MKQFLQCSLLTIMFLGLTWMGNASPVDAYMYGLYGEVDSKYPMQMSNGIDLCYTHMDMGIYIDETSAYVVSHDDSKYILAANMITWDKFYSGRQSVRTKMYMYDIFNHTLYAVNDMDGKFYRIKPHTYYSSEVDMRSAAQAMQIWHAVMGTEWRW